MDEVLPGVEFELILNKAIKKAYREIDASVEVNGHNGVKVSVTRVSEATEALPVATKEFSLAVHYTEPKAEVVAKNGGLLIFDVADEDAQEAC